MKKIKINDKLYTIPETLNELTFEQFINLTQLYSEPLLPEATDDDKLNYTLDIISILLNTSVRELPIAYLEKLIEYTTIIPIQTSENVLNNYIIKLDGVEYSLQTSIRDLLIKDYTAIESYLKADKNIYKNCDKILACLLKPVIRKRINYIQLFKYYLIRIFYKIQKPQHEIEINNEWNYDIHWFSKKIKRNLTNQQYIDILNFFLMRVTGLENNTICYFPQQKKIQKIIKTKTKQK